MTNKPTYEELERRICELEQSKYNKKCSPERLIPKQNLMDHIIWHARSAIMVFDRDLKYIYVSKSSDVRLGTCMVEPVQFF